MQRGSLPPLVKAKLSPPRVADACLRPETLTLLDVCLRRRVTIVCAPAGYGKTTVTVEALRRLGLRSIWYKLDVLDQDPVALIASLVEAVGQFHKGFGGTIRDRLANAHEVPYPVEQMTAEFVAEMTDVVTDDLHVVLDDYHEASDSRPLNATLDYLLANLPRTVRFVVLSRYEPAFGIGKLRLDGEVGVIGVEELRFGPSEVAELVLSRSGTELRPDRASALADLTEGWPASLVLAAMALTWTGVDALEDALSDPRLKQDVFSYLAEQVYSRQTPEVRAFLRRTCCLEYVTADLAASVGTPRRIQRILNHLLANGVFTFATTQTGTVRYHSLFREFLRHKTIQEDGPSRFHRLELDTASALEQHGDVEKAVDLLLAANEPHRALDVVARAGEKNLDVFRSDTLESWLDRLPDHLYHGEPWALLIACQVNMRAGRFDDALRNVDQAIDRFGARSDRSGLYHALSAKERTLFWQGANAHAVEACGMALDVADGREQRVHTLISLGAALEAECRWAEAKQALTRAQELAESAFDGELARVAAHFAYICAHTGRYREAARQIQQATPLVETHGSPSLRMAFFNLAGMNYLFVADWNKSREALQSARLVGQRYGYTFMQALVDDCEAQLHAATGETEQARRFGASAVRAPSIVNDPYCRSLALCHVGTARRRAGAPGNAARWYGRAVTAAKDSTAHYPLLNASANLAYSLAAHSGTTTAKRLGDVQAQANELDLAFVALKCEFFAAALEYRHGDTQEGLDGLARCIPRQLDLGHHNFLLQELVLEPQMALGVLAETRSQQIAESLPDLFARHWNGLSLLVACTTLNPVAGVAAVRAAVAHRSETEIASILVKAARSPFDEVRRAAAAIRKTRRPAPHEDLASRLGLTTREAQILSMMAEGSLNADIASSLVISPATVKTHVNHIFTKLGVHDRVQAVLVFRQARERK